MQYKYINHPIYSPVALKLAEWMCVENNRIKASKLYKLAFKYEELWLSRNEYKLYDYNFNCIPLNLLPSTPNPRPPRT